MKQERSSHGVDLSDDPSMAGSNRVLLLGCVKLKHERPLPARDLYRSPLWVRRRAYAEARGYPWLILSAKHGLVDPARRIAPYDLALSDLRAAARRRWGERVVGALVERFGSIVDVVFEVHAVRHTGVRSSRAFLPEERVLRHRSLDCRCEPSSRGTTRALIARDHLRARTRASARALGRRSRMHFERLIWRRSASRPANGPGI